VSAAVTWVVGAGGLLGQHVRAASQGWVPPAPIPWHDPAAANEALRHGISALLEHADARSWNIAWCAGAGVVATSQEHLDEERLVFSRFLDDLADRAGASTRGAVFLASSAGAVYAGSAQPPFTERSEPRPLAPYGHVKLAMEEHLRAYARATGTPVLVGRIANLYGPGQNLSKPQGLVSQLCLTHLTGRPLPIYVSLDTMRDYLYVRDCAAMVVAALGAVRSPAAADSGDAAVTKILASGRSTTIGALIGESVRLFRRRPRVVLASSPSARGQVRDLRLRSTHWPELDVYARTPLAVGLAATAQDVARRLRSAVPSAR
jgi:UDP-glucose 4-epimerase